MNKIVWAPESFEGYVKGTIIDIGHSTMTVKLFTSNKV